MKVATETTQTELAEAYQAGMESAYGNVAELVDRLPLVGVEPVRSYAGEWA